MEINVSWYEVTDLEAAKRFYGEVLGLKKTLEMEGWVEFSHTNDGPSIGLALAKEPSSAGATVVLRVDDLDQARDELTRQGVQFEGMVEEVPGMVRLASFRDPCGNRLQLCQVLMNQ